MLYNLFHFFYVEKFIKFMLCNIRLLFLLDFQRIAKLYEKYEVIPETNKYTNAYKVIYPFIKQFDFYENLMSEGGFGDGSGK